MSKPPHVEEPKTPRSVLTRARLIEAARAELVERQGMLEVDSVAARADVSVGSIYRHFHSRAGMISAVIDDFYRRYRAEALEINPVPGGLFRERERKRTELSVAFHYADPLAPVILSSLHLDPEVAVTEAQQIDYMIQLATNVMALGIERGEISAGRDPGFIGAMIIGGMRHVLALALANGVSEEETAAKLWTLIAGIMGVEH